jgi:uncharacterized protein YndB with AHSA1/START domain
MSFATEGVTVPEIQKQVTINRPPEDVWAVLGDLANVEWLPGVTGAKVEGGRRVCTTAEGAEIHEEIHDYSDEARRYRYTQTVHPLGLKGSSGTLAVEEENGGARVELEAEIEFADAAQEAQFLPMLDQGYEAALQGLKAKLER